MLLTVALHKCREIMVNPLNLWILKKLQLLNNCSYVYNGWPFDIKSNYAEKIDHWCINYFVIQLSGFDCRWMRVVASYFLLLRCLHVTALPYKCRWKLCAQHRFIVVKKQVVYSHNYTGESFGGFNLNYSCSMQWIIQNITRFKCWGRNGIINTNQCNY